MKNLGNAYLHNGNKQYGNVDTQDTICKQLRRLKEMREVLKINNQHYVSMRGLVKVRWAGVFYDYSKLVPRFECMDTDKPMSDFL